VKNQKSKLSRRKLRALIVQLLYGAEFLPQNLKPRDKPYFFSQKEFVALKDSFIQERIKSIQEKKQKLDELISKQSENWKKERMSLIDLNIMRLAVFEILFCEEVPDKVALNEALELSKRFGDDNSSSFINGILNQILKNKKNLIEQQIS